MESWRDEIMGNDLPMNANEWKGRAISYLIPLFLSLHLVSHVMLPCQRVKRGMDVCER